MVKDESLGFSRLRVLLYLLLKHFPDLADVVAHAAKDPNDSQVKDYGRKVQDCKSDGVVASEFR